ncbi:MAG: hypothetical protein IT535_13380 [Bauldia sp.]|nr:hypothetical protein [Bauldia sp.]
MTRAGGVRALAVAAALAAALAAPAGGAAQDAPLAARLTFPVTFLCGPSSEAFQEGVVSGSYRTVIEILNPSATDAVRFSKAVVRSLPYQAGLRPGLPIEDRLDPGAAIAVECDEIRQLLPEPMSTSFRSGTLVLLADGAVTVSVAYSAGPRGGEVAALDVLAVAGRRFCGAGELGPDGSCRCVRGLAGAFCQISIAEESGPTYLRLKWVGIDAPGDIVRSDDDCIRLEAENFSPRALLANIEFYGTLNGRAVAMLSPLSSLPLEAFETGSVTRCLRDFEGDGGPSDLIGLAFSANINARATVLDGLDGGGGRLDRIFAPTGYFHVEPAPELPVPYRAVLYDDQARRESFGGGDYAGRFPFPLPGGGIFVGDTHPDALFDEGGPVTPEVIPPEP